jgi:hypothetical protein
MASSYPVRQIKMLSFNQDSPEIPCLVDQGDYAKLWGLLVEFCKQKKWFYCMPELMGAVICTKLFEA